MCLTHGGYASVQASCMCDEARLQPMQAQMHRAMWRTDAETWAQLHGKQVPKVKLPGNLDQMIDRWFAAVDVQQRGCISVQSALAALSQSCLPEEQRTISKMLYLMDTDGSGARHHSICSACRCCRCMTAAGTSFASGIATAPLGTHLRRHDHLQVQHW